MIDDSGPFWGHRVLVLLCLVFTAFVPGLPAGAHGGDIEVVLEAATQDGSVDYGLAIRFADGDPVAGAHVVLHAEQGDQSELAEASEDSAGVYFAEIQFPAPGEWRVDVTIDHSESEGSIQFHQTVADGASRQWLVVVDTKNPDQEGTTPDPERAILDPSQASASTTTTTTAVTSTGANSASSATTTTTTSAPLEATERTRTDVVVELSAEETDPLGAIGMRVVHLGSIGLWLIPVFAGVFGRTTRPSIVLALVGIVLTAATGVLLMLWGAPVAFPGIFDGSGLGDVSQGSSYQTAFLVKMGAVLTAALATLGWAWKQDRKAVWVALGGGVVAAVAVTAMSQYHLLSHL